MSKVKVHVTRPLLERDSKGRFRKTSSVKESVTVIDLDHVHDPETAPEEVEDTFLEDRKRYAADHDRVIAQYNDEHPYLLGIVHAAYCYGFIEAMRTVDLESRGDIEEENFVDDTLREANQYLDLTLFPLRWNSGNGFGKEGAFAFKSLLEGDYYGMDAIEACQRLARTDEEREMLDALRLLTVHVMDAQERVWGEDAF